MNILKKFDQLSYRTSFFLCIGITILLFLPILLFAVQNRTQLTSKAALVLPTPTPLAKTYGSLPTSAPTITRVWPWVGKPGDTIIIEGKNFGTNPPDSRIAIGNVVIDDSAILDWSDTRIELVLPTDAPSGSPVQLRVGTYPVVESVPLVFYDDATPIRLHKTGTNITSQGILDTVQVSSWTSVNGQIQKKTTTYVGKPGAGTTLLTLAPSETLLSLVLRDKNGAVIPYVVDPIEFGF